MKTAVITGGTGGLGRALSIELGLRGFSVLALFHRDTSAADDLRELMAERGVAGRVLQRDITDRAVQDSLATDELVRGASELVLVNNACAPFEPKPFHLLDWDEIALGLDTAARGSFFCTKALLRTLVAKRGAVVNVLSRAVTGETPKGFGGYIIAKSALLGMTKALAAEYAAQGLRVFSVSPGFMETPLTAGWDSRLLAQMSDGPPRTPEAVARDIADLVTNGKAAGRGEDHAL